MYHNFNNSFSYSSFPSDMKYAEVTRIHKADDKTDKGNYRPINILLNLSKFYDRLMYNQIHIFKKYSPNFSVGFGKVLIHSTVS